MTNKEKRKTALLDLLSGALGLEGATEKVDALEDGLKTAEEELDAAGVQRKDVEEATKADETPLDENDPLTDVAKMISKNVFAGAEGDLSGLDEAGLTALVAAALGPLMEQAREESSKARAEANGAAAGLQAEALKAMTDYIMDGTETQGTLAKGIMDVMDKIEEIDAKVDALVPRQEGVDKAVKALQERLDQTPRRASESEQTLLRVKEGSPLAEVEKDIKEGLGEEQKLVGGLRVKEMPT